MIIRDGGQVQPIGGWNLKEVAGGESRPSGLLDFFDILHMASQNYQTPSNQPIRSLQSLRAKRASLFPAWKLGISKKT